MNPPSKPFRYLSVFSGMEAATVAWHHMGWQPVGFSEIEPFPSAILKHHYEHTPNFGDITQFKSWPIERGSVDLLVGGSPCQAFSVAGLRQGLADPRGNLALTFLALADHLRPKYILWENVPGVLSSSGGRDFGSFIGALAKLGYGFAWRVCDAQYFGVPQRRKRVFLLAVEGAGNWRTAAEILFERKSVCGHIKESNRSGQSTTSDAGESVETGGPTILDRAAFNQGQNAQYEPLIEQTETCPTLVGRGPHAVVSPIAIQGTVIGRNDNAGPSKGFGEIDDPMFTLTTNDVHAVLQPITSQVGNLLRAAGADPSTEATTTLKASSGDQTPCVFHPLDLRNATRDPDKRDAINRQGVQAFDAFNQTVSNTSQTLSCSASDVNHTGAVFSPTMAVRRLTPVECERLQGFPDNYSRIPWKSKSEEQCQDGPRYKTCGNSMAIPVMRWIGERINQHELSQTK